MKANRVKVEDLLRQMKGKSFLYNTQQVKILNFHFKGDMCSVATDGPWVEKSCDDMLAVLEHEFLPVDESDEDPIADIVLAGSNDSVPAVCEPSLPTGVPAGVRAAVVLPESTPMAVQSGPHIETVKYFSKLSAVLLDNIKRVQENKDYVDQAQQVTLSVRTFVDMAKVEIDANRMLREVQD